MQPLWLGPVLRTGTFSELHSASFIPVGRRRGLRLLMLLDIVVHHIFEFLAGLEEGDFLGGDFYSVAGFGVAANAGLALAGAEAAKPADLDLVSGPQGTHHTFEDSLHNYFT